MRPGCDVFLKEMSEIYEVVIFTAAMQDVSDFNDYLLPVMLTYKIKFSMRIGC